MRGTFVYLVPAFLFFLACTKDSGRPNTGGFPDDIAPIFARNCAASGCHTSQSREAAGGINLESWQALFRGSSNGSPVIPFSSRHSSLMYFINSYDEFGLKSEPTMPLNGKPLSRAEVGAIKTWIDNGARDRNGNVMWADDPYRKKLYVVNQGCDVVTVLDAATALPIRYVETGISAASDVPHQVRVSPDGRYWYVIFINSPFMQKFRCSDDTYVGDIPLTPFAAGLTGDATQNALDWNAFAISSDGKKAYCTSTTQNGKISVVDLEHHTFVKWVGGQHFPHGIVFDKSGGSLYVSAQTGNFITELDTGLNSATMIPLQGSVSYLAGLDIHDMILSPDGKDLLVTCQGSNEVRILDLGAGTVKAVVPTGVFPQEIVFSGKSGRYYVSCPGDTTAFSGSKGVITSFDALSYSPRSLACGYQPHGIAVNEVSNTLFVLSRNLTEGGIPPHHGSVCNGRNGFLSIVDLTDFSVRPGNIELSVDPYFISSRP